MLCWSCRKEIPETAKLCPHCEAAVEEEPTPEELDAAAGMLANMAPDVLNALQEALRKSDSGEDFVNRLMVGDCPKCGKSNTSDCENDPEIGDPCIGRCFDCGQLWCCDCDELFKDAQSTEHDCPFWEDFDDEEFDADDLELP
jgi:hypothetical protein